MGACAGVKRYFVFALSMQSWRSVPVSPAQLGLEDAPPELEDAPPELEEAPPEELLSLELPVDGVLGDEAELSVDELPLGDDAGLLGDELLLGAPASLLDDPLDEVPPALLLVPPLAPPAPAPAPAPAPCAQEALAKPTKAAVMAALINLSFIGRFPLGLGWGLRRAPRKNNAPGSKGLSLQGFSAR